MKQMSLVSVCNEYGLSRRTIQGYEKSGLVNPTGKTNRGYLVYDDKTIRKILFIKHCQNMGFTIKEITEFIDKPKDIIKERFKNQIPRIQTKLDSTKQLIESSKRIIVLLDENNSDETIFEITRKENI